MQNKAGVYLRRKLAPANRFPCRFAIRVTMSGDGNDLQSPALVLAS